MFVSNILNNLQKNKTKTPKIALQGLIKIIFLNYKLKFFTKVVCIICVLIKVLVPAVSH